MKSQPTCDSPSCALRRRRGSCRPWSTDMLVCMPLPLTPVTGLGRKLAVMSMLRRDLAAEQLVELHLVGGDQRLGVAVVHLELRGRHLGVVLLVREAHRALHLGGGVDEACAARRRAASGSSRRWR